MDACCCDVNVARANLLRQPSAAALCAHHYLAHRGSSRRVTYSATVPRNLHHNHTRIPTEGVQCNEQIDSLDCRVGRNDVNSTIAVTPALQSPKR